VEFLLHAQAGEGSSGDVGVKGGCSQLRMGEPVGHGRTAALGGCLRVHAASPQVLAFSDGSVGAWESRAFPAFLLGE